MTPPISQKLRYFRLYRNYTQHYVAAKLGLSVRSYRKLEQGSVSMSVDQLIKIAQILDINVSIDLYITNSDSDFYESSFSKFLLKEARAMLGEEKSDQLFRNIKDAVDNFKMK